MITSLYTKPTDAHRYLHRLSFHPPHTFNSLPFSQMRRAVLICSDENERESQVDKMVTYFLSCGYNLPKLKAAKDRALSLNRSDLLNHSRPAGDNAPLVFVTKYNANIQNVKAIINEFKTEFDRLVGDTDIIVACRRNANTSGLLFNKHGFSQRPIATTATNQRCGSTNCMMCPIMFNALHPIKLNQYNLTIKFNNSLTCKSEDVIYIAQCTKCNDFYFGRTMNEARIRFNGHRSKFNTKAYKSSALSLHIYQDHPELVSSGLKNFQIGLIEQPSTSDLDRREDFYIWKTNSSINHLNRYKVS